MKVNENMTPEALEKLEDTLTKLIEADGLKDTQVTEDGVRIGKTFFWCDHDCLGRYYQGSWEKANAGEDDLDADNNECSVSDVLVAHAEYQGAKLSMILKDLPEKTQQAVTAYWENKRDNCGFAWYDTLEDFARVFNPLADELYSQRRMAFNSPTFNQIQAICIDLFEYGDCKWPGQVYESGVPSMIGK